MVQFYSNRAIRCQNPFYFPDRKLVEHIHLPPLKRCKHFINLTNGIEVLPRLQRLGIQPSYARITSTSLEQQQFERLVLNELDPNLLLHLALGECCLLYDYGSRNKNTGASRAIWYGREFIRYVLNRLWLDMDPADTPVYLRGFNAAPEFEKIIRNFDKSSRKRIKYYKQYVSSGTLTEQQKGVQLFGVYAPTSNDNNSQFYINTLRESYYNQTISSSTHSTELDLSEEERYLLYEGDIHVAVEKFLGAKIFMGGISDAEYFKWQQKREEKEEGGGSPY